MLYGLGTQLDIPSWQRHWLQHCAHRSPQNPGTETPPSSAAESHATPVLLAEPAGATQTHDFESSSGMLEGVLQSLTGLTVGSPQTGDKTNAAQHLQHDALAGIDTHKMSDVVTRTQQAEDSEESLACHKFIENIRETEFGMGVELGASGAELRQKMNERLGRALQRLSQDLYSKDVHFVLELVQNADDNEYEANVWPAVEFILQDSGITIVNNEVSTRTMQKRFWWQQHINTCSSSLWRCNIG